ncbi:MAG: TetR/AcrR family transcriptional regulator [Clostridia bacterium]|nr:TetR/AcrR family transcriptional regulator [Clostridia bacterium]
MEAEQGLTSVREQLIVAGIAELEAHGIPDFSLRRVAAACNLSCAAPYKHFKDKDALIEAIFAYIREQLRLLLAQVEAVYAGDPRRQLVESCVAYVRFCLANPHFRAVMTLSGGSLPLADTVEPLLRRCAPEATPERRQEQALVLRALTHGAALLLESGELPNDERFMERFRRRLHAELENL